MDESRPEALFRANKRRKVMRKRNPDDGGEAAAEARGGSVEPEDDGNDTRVAVKRPAAKRQGVVFSTATAPAQSSNTRSMETALVPFPSENAQMEQATQHDRFTKPTGRAEVVEDKHLTAYVDSRLAELRSSAAEPIQSLADQTTLATSLESPAPGSDQAQDEQHQTERADANSNGPDQHKKVHASGATRKTKPRRRPPVRDENSIVRDAMIDQILGGSDVPIYDRVPQAAHTKSAADGVDADEAAARAFKEQFLVDAAQRIRRKPPAAPANSREVKTTSHGPKLGGSRSQREKMRALEEAKKATKK